MVSFEEFLRSNLNSLPVSQKMKDFFLSARPAVLFGCGHQGRIGMDLCHMFHKKCFSFLVSDGGQRLCPYWRDIPMYTLSTFPEEQKKNVDVIVCVNEKYNMEIKNTLTYQGFERIFLCENWTRTNEILRREWHNLYLSRQIALHPGKILFEKTDNGETYLKIDMHGKSFKMYYPDTPLERSAILGNFCDIILPSCFEENRYVTEGPYEYGNVNLQEGDVVFDLGSNLGMFSSVALSKGCIVHAFEPTPDTIKILEKYLMLSEGEFHIWPYAITDKKDEICFNINDGCGQDLDIGINSIMYRKNSNKSITVPAIDLDTFVNENNIQHIDFIKADIEGAERYMLSGGGGYYMTLPQSSPFVPIIFLMILRSWNSSFAMLIQTTLLSTNGQSSMPTAQNADKAGTASFRELTGHESLQCASPSTWKHIAYYRTASWRGSTPQFPAVHSCVLPMKPFTPSSLNRRAYRRKNKHGTSDNL